MNLVPNMLNPARLIPFLLAAHVFGTATPRLNAFDHLNVIGNAVGTMPSGAGAIGAYDATSVPIPEVVMTVLQNVTIITCPENLSHPSTSLEITASNTTLSISVVVSTPCDVEVDGVINQNTSLAPRTSHYTSTPYATSYITHSLYLCSIGGFTSTRTVTETSICDATIEPKQTGGFPTGYTEAVLLCGRCPHVEIPATPTPPCTTSSDHNHASALNFELHPTIPSGTLFNPMNSAPHDTICSLLGLAVIGYIAWLIVML